MGNRHYWIRGPANPKKRIVQNMLKAKLEEKEYEL